MFLENPQPRIDNKKSLLCSRAFLRRIVSTDYSLTHYHLNELNLRKYFPKYIHDLHIEVTPGSSISRIKRIKTLRSFKDPTDRNEPQAKNFQRTLLYNKKIYS